MQAERKAFTAEVRRRRCADQLIAETFDFFRAPKVAERHASDRGLTKTRGVAK